jgi:hypothetical protein
LRPKKNPASLEEVPRIHRHRRRVPAFAGTTR